MVGSWGLQGWIMLEQILNQEWIRVGSEKIPRWIRAGPRAEKRTDSNWIRG